MRDGSRNSHTRGAPKAISSSAAPARLSSCPPSVTTSSSAAGNTAKPPSASTTPMVRIGAESMRPDRINMPPRLDSEKAAPLSLVGTWTISKTRWSYPKTRWTSGTNSGEANTTT